MKQILLLAALISLGFTTYEPYKGSGDDLQDFLLDMAGDSEDQLTATTYSRRFANTEWQALYVPFALSYAQWSDHFDVARLTGGSIDDGESLITGVKMTAGDGDLQPHTPYLIRAKQVGTYTFSVTGGPWVNADGNWVTGADSWTTKAISSQCGSLIITGNYGHLSDLKVNNCYCMMGGSLWVPSASSYMLKPFRWYAQPKSQVPIDHDIPSPGIEGSRAVKVRIADGTTAQSRGAQRQADRAEAVNIPVQMPVVDLSTFASAIKRTTTLEVKTDVKFTNGTISSAAAFGGDGPLLKVSDSVTVVIDATASVSAASATIANCLTAVGIYGGSSVIQYGDVTAPGNGTGYALYLDTEGDTYNYVAGTTKGKIHRPSGKPSDYSYNGRTWMVGDDSPVAYHFADINAAMASTQVNDGDILLVDRLAVKEVQTVTKSVKIIGNAAYWASRQAYVDMLQVEAPHVTVTGMLVTNTVTIRNDNARLEKCTILGSVVGDKNYICDYAVIDGCHVASGVEAGRGYGWTVTNSQSAEPTALADMPRFSSISVPPTAQTGTALPVDYELTNVSSIALVEYFWDSDPGWGKATPLTTATGSYVTSSKGDLTVPTDTLTLGDHVLVVRARSNSGYWVTEKFEDIRLLPHPIDGSDLAALKLISDNLGLDGYWNFDREGAYESDFPGVTFVNHRVTEIDLENRGCSGTLSADWMPELTELTHLNLSRNNITGDVAPLVAHMPQLRSLDLSYNRVTMVSGALPPTVETVDLKSQNRLWDNGNTGAAEEFTPEVTASAAMPLKVTVDDKVALTLPSLFDYNFKANDSSLRADVLVADCQEPATIYGTYGYSDEEQGWQFTPWQNGTITLADDTRVALVATGEWQQGSAMPAVVAVTPGDANIDGKTNILDVQHTLNHILATAQPFNFWAADTYADKTINVQDVVSTINIFIEQPNEASQMPPTHDTVDDNPTPGTHHSSSEAQCWLCEQGERITVTATVDVAALDVEISGVSTDEVSLLLSHDDFQMVGRNTAAGARFVVFSPTGAAIAAGKSTALFAMSRRGSVAAVSCADSEARAVTSDVTVDTAISETVAKVQGTEMMETPLAPGIVIVRTTNADGTTSTVKVLKK